MSQLQPQRPSEDQEHCFKYDEVFSTVKKNMGRQVDSGREKSSNNESNTDTVGSSSSSKEQSPVTIVEALLATVVTAGSKAVDRSDAAAIQAAEVRATGQTNIMPGGLAATAQSAAQINAKSTTTKKTTLSDVLSDAATKLLKDRPVTRQDAEGVVSAEFRNNPNISTFPGGISTSMIAAARINLSLEQSKN